MVGTGSRGVGGVLDHSVEWDREEGTASFGRNAIRSAMEP